MDFHFFVMEKSLKISVEKEGATWYENVYKTLASNISYIHKLLLSQD